MTGKNQKWLVRAFVMLVILAAVVTILLGFGRLANLVAGLLIAGAVVGWVIAWRTGKETITFVPGIVGLALVCSAGLLILFALGDTPPSTLRSGPGDFVPNGTGRIAYVERWQIWVMNADGTGETPLTGDEVEAGFPAWSPDSKQLALEARDEIYVMDADGTDATRLTNSLAADNTCPRWSPDGQRIAFLSDRDGVWDAYVMNADGTNQARLTVNYQNNWCTPAWSPDGRRLAFVSNHSDGSSGIYLVDADATDPLQLPRDTRYKFKNTWRAAWSPDGKQVAFKAPDGVYSMDADGTNRSRLTDLGSFSHSCDDPVWSPDGQHIAFVGTKGGENICVINADGTDQTCITTYEAYPAQPYAYVSSLIWSPDGKRIAYEAGVPLGLNAVGLDGTDLVHLGGGDWPAWAP